MLQRSDWLIYLQDNQSPPTASLYNNGPICCPVFFSDCLSLKDGVDELFGNVDKHLQTHAV